MTNLDEARALAGLLLPRSYLAGSVVPPADVRERIDTLLRPFVPDELWLETLRLDEAIAKLEEVLT